MTDDDHTRGVDLWPAPSEPLKVADRYLLEVHTTPEGTTLQHHRGDFYKWHTGVWAQIPPSAIRAALYDLLRDAEYDHPKNGTTAWAPTTRKIGDVLDALRSAIYLREDRDAPTWITPGDRHPAREYIAMRNGLLHVPSGQVQSHTSAMFNTIQIPFDYDATAQAPHWTAFLRSVWPNDPAMIEMLQQWFGYVLSGRTDFQKAMMIPGPPRSGKGTIVRVLTELLGGRRYVAAPTMADIGTHFGITPIIGKPLAVIGDARVGRGGERQVVERLLTITGEDNLTVDVKYKDAWTGKVGARFMILSNELPRFGDASGAIASRFLVARTTHSFLGREDKGLERRLHTELPGVFNWAIAGLEHLTKAGRFTESDGSKEERDALTALASPVSMFLDEYFTPSMDGWVATDRLYGRWRSWCELAGESPGSRAVFARDLVAAAPMQKYRLRPQKKGPKGGQRTGYAGIAEISTSTTMGIITDTPDTSRSKDISAQLPFPDTGVRGNDMTTPVAEVGRVPETVSDQQVSGVSVKESIVSPLRNSDDAAPTMTCAAWTRQHALQLIEEGVRTVESRDWYDVGRTAGFKIDNLRRAVMESDLISTAARSGRSVTFALGTGGVSTAVSCPDWLGGWLCERGWVLASDAYNAGEQAGYERATIKSAAKRISVLRRGTSIHTEWKFNPASTKESA